MCEWLGINVMRDDLLTAPSRIIKVYLLTAIDGRNNLSCGWVLARL